MAELTENQRIAIWKKLMRDFKESTSLEKTELRAALNATDNWIDTNQTAYKTFLPEPAKSALTTIQLVQLFTYVSMKRFEVC